MSGAFMRFAVASMSNGQHFVLVTTDAEQTLLTPEAADQAADRLRLYAESARASTALLASAPGALAALLCNPGARA